MSGTTPAPGRGDPIAPPARPLPDALRRVRIAHPVSLRDRRPDALRLAEAAWRTVRGLRSATA